MFSDHSGTKLTISKKNITGKHPNVSKLSDVLKNNPQVNGKKNYKH